MKPNPRVLVPVALVVLAAVAYAALRPRAPHDTLTASGTVEGTEAQLGFQAPGRIDSVGPLEGDTVRTGAVLARLDVAQAEAQHAQTVAAVAAARQALLQLEHGSRPQEIAQARAARDAAQKSYDDAKLDYDRAQDLVATGAIARQAFDKARTTADVAQAQLRQAEEQYRLVVAGPRRENVEVARAQLQQANAAEQAARAALDYMVVRAPFNGVVTVRHHEPGEIVPAGTPVLSVLNRDDRWVRIYVREDRVGAVKVGQPATITTDTWPGRRYAGRVAAVANEAEFTPKNVQTNEERVKLVYAVKVRITGDAGYDLKPGMPADVRLDTASPTASR